MLGKNFIYNAHALGQYKGFLYTNSLEAFEQSYRKGFRYFEADIAITSDQQYVLSHETDTVSRLSEDAFHKREQRWTCLSLDTFFDIMRNKCDVHAMLDFLPGYYNHHIPKDIENISKRIIESGLRERILLEVYSEDNLMAAKDAGLSDRIQMFIGDNFFSENIEDYIYVLKKNGVKYLSISMMMVKKHPDIIKMLHVDGFIIFSAIWNSYIQLFRYSQTKYIDYITTDYLHP